MPLPQVIAPINSESLDVPFNTLEEDWIPDPVNPELAAFKLLWAGPEKGSFAVLFQWKKGFVLPPHKHLGSSHTYMLKGKLQLRDCVLSAGDYTHESNGMIHGATTALEDTEYLFIMDGAVLFYDDNHFLGYIHWEEMVRIRDAYYKAKNAA